MKGERGRKPPLSLSEDEVRDIKLWIGWCFVFGDDFKSGREAIKAMLKQALHTRKDKWLAISRPKRKLILNKIDELMKIRLTAKTS